MSPTSPAALSLDPSRRFLFPDEGAVSVVVAISDGAAIEAGMIGQEGVVGTEAIFGTGNSFTRR